MTSRACEAQARAAARRDAELARAEEAARRARYFHTHAGAARRYEAWTDGEYYERANREAEELARNKMKSEKLEERRKKLEKMLFQEKLQFQEELKSLASKPKLFKNGSYLNSVSTSTLADINQGVRDKEEELRRREAELRLHHAWRARQPALRDAAVALRAGALKSAWMEQMVEKEMQKKKEEEEAQRSLRERDEYLQRQIQIEQERVKEKEAKMQDLKEGLERQMARLSEAETAVRALRKQEEREIYMLEQLRFINEERLKQHEKLQVERTATLVNLALHRHRLRQRAAQVEREIQLDLDAVQRMWDAIEEEYQERKESAELSMRILEEARRSLREQRDRERQRQQHIDAMFDGEARQINEKQDKLWAREREARAALLAEVAAALGRQVSERLEASRERQRESVRERERMLDDVESYHRELRQREKEKQLETSQYSGIVALQSQLKGLELEAARQEEARAQAAAARAALDEEALLQRELVRLQRDGAADTLPGRRRHAW